ncbi:MAG TPA: TraB/GumN family protein [Gammaproteobacteria bacterium]
MRRALAAALLAACAIGPLHADPAAWRVVSRDGGELWLLGSMHYLKDSDYPLPASIDRLFAAAEALAMELDLDDLDPAAEQAALLGAALLPPGVSLADVLGEAEHARAAEQAAALGVDLALLERFEPWLVAITLLDRGMSRLGYRADRGVERYLVGKAQEAGKEIVGLETTAEQIAVFDALPPEEQRGLLEQTLQELARPASAIEHLAELWRAGELETLARELEGEFEGFPELYRALVVGRNARWVPALEGFLREGRRYLVVVGALHLVGRDSVVDLLERRGYTVERIPDEAEASQSRASTP